VKIAVPLFKDEKRLHPYFGASHKFLVVDVDQFKIINSATLDLAGEDPLSICNTLVKIGVNLIICGGINSNCKTWLIERGVAVTDNRKGLVHNVLKQFMNSPGTNSTYP